MSNPFETKRAATLGKILEKRTAARTKAGDAVRALAAHGMERWNDTVARLGNDHPAVVAYRAADDFENEILAECRRRYGPAVTYDSQWATFLAVYREPRKPRGRW